MFKFTSDYPDFWVQLKGDNAGKPLKNPIPNSIGVKCDPEQLVPGFLFWTFQYLFLAGKFKPFIKGSVIPYIRRVDIVRVLLDHFVKTHIIPNLKEIYFSNGVPEAEKITAGQRDLV